jgi:hypothetical protein
MNAVVMKSLGLSAPAHSREAPVMMQRSLCYVLHGNVYSAIAIVP